MGERPSRHDFKSILSLYISFAFLPLFLSIDRKSCLYRVSFLGFHSSLIADVLTYYNLCVCNFCFDGVARVMTDGLFSSYAHARCDAPYGKCLIEV
ncbi:hypothetical protein DFP72DRAFT_893402 [Ephemerocybe angulata]|uniref:Uncharacterized protein n=1 Tax=Ephemerocybe angulata TaxID=980116 RepID=A0A8H6M5P5_9AGAR|nr:hypothetical protein DFP72DRAFT_893369 [Tulosesus angulatus]KAF6756663.1 hypothetical protein DFP72DRAFT_893402 [Tulosesus angulatus]